ncbi:MTR protein, partial [Ramphastos sulfuratus]|nr:MTR protein [Ramphastos sulfuratus]
QIHIFSLRDVGNGVYDCWADFIQPWGPKAYVTWITLMVYIIPVLMLSICYGLISFKIWQNVRLKTAAGPSAALSGGARGGQALARVSSTRLISKAKIRTVKMTFIIVLAFIICWTPFFFVQMWSVWDTNAPQEASPFIIAMLLASLNSCCNPWIYMLYTGHLFHDLSRRLLCCSAQCLKSRPACQLGVGRKSNSSSFVLSCKSTSQRSFVQQPST